MTRRAKMTSARTTTQGQGSLLSTFGSHVDTSIAAVGTVVAGGALSWLLTRESGDSFGLAITSLRHWERLLEEEAIDARRRARRAVVAYDPIILHVCSRGQWLLAEDWLEVALGNGLDDWLG